MNVVISIIDYPQPLVEAAKQRDLYFRQREQDRLAKLAAFVRENKIPRKNLGRGGVSIIQGLKTDQKIMTAISDDVEPITAPQLCARLDLSEGGFRKAAKRLIAAGEILKLKPMAMMKCNNYWALPGLSFDEEKFEVVT